VHTQSNYRDSGARRRSPVSVIGSEMAQGR
jgi:hypothetical protein